MRLSCWRKPVKDNNCSWSYQWFKISAYVYFYCTHDFQTSKSNLYILQTISPKLPGCFTVPNMSPTIDMSILQESTRQLTRISCMQSSLRHYLIFWLLILRIIVVVHCTHDDMEVFKLSLPIKIGRQILWFSQQISEFPGQHAVFLWTKIENAAAK